MISRTKPISSLLTFSLSTVTTLCIHTAAPQASAASIVYELVASASTNNGQTLTSDVSSINNSGYIAHIYTDLVSNKPTEQVRIVSTTSGPVVVTQARQQAPGLSVDHQFRSFGTSGFLFPPFRGFPVINDAAQVAFYANASIDNLPGSAVNGLWATTPGSALYKIASEGDSVPGVPGLGFNSINGFPALNNPVNGQSAVVAFRAYADDSLRSGGIWAATPGFQPIKIAFHGENAPGRSDQFDISLTTLGKISYPALNGNGNVAFGANTTNGSGIWAGAPGNLDIVVSDGEPAPGTSNTFIRFPVVQDDSSVSLNNNGQVVFRAITVEGSGAESGVWVGTPSATGYDLNKIAVTGDQTGLSGITFADLSTGSEPVINRNGNIAFAAKINDNNTNEIGKQSIWLSKSGITTPTLLARVGDIAPGTGGALFSSFNSYGSSSEDYPPLMNNAGHIVFQAEAGGVNGIWAWTGDKLEVIAYSDAFLPLTSSGGEDGRARVLSDTGELIYQAIVPGGGLIISATLPILGDLNSDGFVGQDDLNLIFANWNQTVPPADPLADPSGDGTVGIDDLNIVLGNWNAGVPPSGGSAVPEPASLALLGLGGLAMLRRK